MQVYNHELQIRRGETFTIDKILQNRDGSPYIISSKLKNPHFLITVSSALYDKDDRYSVNAWCPIRLPRFHTTQPVSIHSFKDESGNQIYDSFDTMTGLPQGYVNGFNVAYEMDDALFYQVNSDGSKTYKFWTGKEWHEYKCRIAAAFTNQVTSKWIEKSYYYNIDLVSGISIKEYLSILCKQAGIEPDGVPENMYAAIKEYDENLIKNIDIAAQLVNIDSSLPILPPTKLSVLSNLKGGI